MNAGFIIEMIEIISKLLTIGLCLLGLEFSTLLLHNFLVFTFIITSLLINLAVLVSYSSLRIQVK